MSTRNILRRAAPTGVQTQAVQSHISVMKRIQAGNKDGIRDIMQSGNLSQYDMTTKLTPAEIDAFSADQLYELAYGGNVDYFRSPIFEGPRREETQFVASLVRDINVAESIYKCSHCGYNRILVKQVQIGGGDESMTTIYRCAHCGNGWSNSGRG